MKISLLDFRQVIILLLLSLSAGALRQMGPDNLKWMGRWPSSGMSAEEAFYMMALEGDPPFVSLEEAISYFQHEAAVFLDARTPKEFSEGRITGSRNLPFYELEAFQDEALREVAEDTLLIIYCEGIGCELSFFLGRELREVGYRNVRIFYGGFPEWSKAGLPVEQ